jgi:hypothetical protein
MQKLTAQEVHGVTSHKRQPRMPSLIAPMIRANVEFQIVPADGIRLPFSLEAETSERRRFLGST